MATFDSNDTPPVAGQQSAPMDVGANATFNIGVQSTDYYQMRGYYAAGAAFETWTAMGAPSTSPPSGHSLIAIVVVSRWSG